jgi:hypothetical protein
MPQLLTMTLGCCSGGIGKIVRRKKVALIEL